ncbi:MAG TPA: DUF5709 domain-containing protein [Actinomycetales bacterium]|nr:DUF5709 domain-containing protein [Actinomycetales bacterium]
MTQYDDSSAETAIEQTNDGVELGAYSIDDEDQPGAESFLLDRGVDDPLDEGYSPPERPRGVEAFGTTATEEREGESLEERLRQEEPDPAMAVDDPLADTDEVDDTADGEPGGAEGALEADEFLDEGQVGGRRAGRLVDPDEGVREDTEKDVVGSDVGIDGGAASAEEAAMHIIDEP